MKICVFGINSYIGNMFGRSCQDDSEFELVYVDSKGNAWESQDFRSFDVILHIAGIAHISMDHKMESIYYTVNRDLPIRVANKAKQEGVKQFIFLSSMIVYGDPHGIKDIVNIKSDTKPKPENFYGKSKLEADECLQTLADDSFYVSVLRLPMVYGQGCKGNFPKLVELTKRIKIFPDINNERSMIYIDNLCEFFKLCIRNRYSGVFYPQNAEYVSTKAIIGCAAAIAGRKMRFISIINPIIYLLSPKINSLNKVFGSKTYDKSLCPDLKKYNLYSFEESMKRYFEQTL
jgi:UDP-glucose 4-epimerase